VTGDCHAPFWGSPGVTPPGHPTLPRTQTTWSGIIEPVGLMTGVIDGLHRGTCQG
jgi:hypothetical protein